MNHIKVAWNNILIALLYLLVLYTFIINWRIFENPNLLNLFFFVVILFFPPYIYLTLNINRTRNKIIDYLEANNADYLLAKKVTKKRSLSAIFGTHALDDFLSFLDGNLFVLPGLPKLKYIQKLQNKIFVLFSIRVFYTSLFFVSFSISIHLKVRSEESLIFLLGVLLGLILYAISFVVFIYKRTKHPRDFT